MAVAGAIRVKRLMERVVDGERAGKEQEQRQQTNKRWFCQTAKAGKCSFPIHLYACNQSQEFCFRK